MAKFNLRKRNKVIRKYCPELFEKEPPSDKGKLLGAGDVPIDALMLIFDEAGQPTDAWAIKRHVLRNIFSNDESFKRIFCTVRERHLETDTIVFDIGVISREAGRDMTTEIFRAASDRPFRLRADYPTLSCGRIIVGGGRRSWGATMCLHQR
jgi:hypothetical protein